MRIGHRNITAVIVTAAAVLTVGLFIPRAGISKIELSVKPDISSKELLAVVIEDFENGKIAKSIDEDGWLVTSTPKQYIKAETEEKLKQKNPVPILDMKFVDGCPGSLDKEKYSITELGKEKKKCLGVRFKFMYPGSNSIHILVPKEVEWKSKKPVLTYNPSTRKDEQERGIQLPGKSKAISLWVHGRGNPYDLEVWIKDYKGDTHILKFGSVNFVGWRPLEVPIPIDVPQTYESYPQTRVTKIIRFVLRAQVEKSKEELIENTYFFFDQLKVLTDTYEVNFDGNELHKAFEGGSSGSGGKDNK